MGVHVDWRTSVSLVGSVLTWVAVPLAPCLALAIVDGRDVVPFAITIAVALGVGQLLRRRTDERRLYDREAFLMVALTWLAVAVVGAIPLIVAGDGVFGAGADSAGEAWINALFESTSGITTTGATVIDSFDVHSRAILLWRQLIQWLGGLGILIVATAVLSRLSVGGAKLMETESQTKDVTRLTTRFADTARLLLRLYAGLTLASMAALAAVAVLGIDPELTLFDAIAHPLSAISTAGFSPRPLSAGAFGPVVQWILLVTMAVGATNFVLIFAVLRGDVARLRESEEFWFYLAILLSLSAVLGAILVSDAAFAGFEATIRHSLFQVVSIVTTTGYATVNFDLWSAPAKQILLVCMFVGGMAGSTTCSIKAFRWLVVGKAFGRDLFVAAKPETVRPVRLSGQVVDEETIRDVYSYTLISLLFFFLGSVVLVVLSARAQHTVTELEALGASAATFFNVGPAFGQAGPYESYASFPPLSKGFMTVMMWVGRIEIIPVLVMLRLSFWRRP